MTVRGHNLPESASTVRRENWSRFEMRLRNRDEHVISISGRFDSGGMVRWGIIAVILTGSLLGVGPLMDSLLMADESSPTSSDAEFAQNSSLPETTADDTLNEGGVEGASSFLVEDGDREPAEPLPPTDPDTVQLPINLLELVRHRTLHVRDEEREAYYFVLAQARDSDYQSQLRAAQAHRERRRPEIPQLQDRPDLPFPAFVDLFQNPEENTGELVTLRGRVRRLIEFPAGENDYGFDVLYEAWLYTDDSQQHPIVIICADVPDGIPMGQTPGMLIDDVSVTGYFFKLYGYEAQDTTRVAPMVLAQRLEWTPVEEMDSARILLGIFFAGVAVGVVAILCYLLYLSRKERQFRESRLKREAQLDASLFEAPSGEPESPFGSEPPPSGESPDQSEGADSDDVPRREQ